MSTDPAGTIPPSTLGSGLAQGRPRLLTWGLLRPGNGIEHAIRAIALLGDRRRDVRYLIAGPTHPAAFAADGDQYREWLTRTAWEAGVASSVRVDGVRREPEVLAKLVASASAVILPDDPSDEVVSSVLTASVAAGRPVIATAFPHAVELLGAGAGIVVPHGDAVALAGAIESILDDPSTLETMATQARQIAPPLAWSTADGQYRALRELVAAATEAQ